MPKENLREGHEEKFRHEFELIDEVKNDPYWIQAYEVAATSKLTVFEINQIGLVLRRRKTQQPILEEINK